MNAAHMRYVQETRKHLLVPRAYASSCAAISVEQAPLGLGVIDVHVLEAEFERGA